MLENLAEPVIRATSEAYAADVIQKFELSNDKILRLALETAFISGAFYVLKTLNREREVTTNAVAK